MKQTLVNIIGALRKTKRPLAPAQLDRIMRARNREVRGPVRHVAKKNLLPFYQDLKANHPQEWAALNIDEALEAQLVRTLQVKPRRTASGVATITVLTKPWPCSGACIYCPNDVRMPKSYLHDEPACQRAERNYFDPYLQVSVRLHTLQQMGHVTDKVELIVLGGTFSDYPRAYQIWFMHELLRALNEAGAGESSNTESDVDSSDFAALRSGYIAYEPTVGAASHTARRSKNPAGNTTLTTSSSTGGTQENAATRRQQYVQAGILCERDELEKWAASTQAAVTAGQESYNQAVPQLFRGAWDKVAAWQQANLEQLEQQHATNENAAHRCVGLVVETRPDAVNAESLTLLRQLGCTKIQMGIQSLDPALLQQNCRGITPDVMASAFELTRAFGFKSHAHFMANLLGATPASDAADYLRLVRGQAFQPDEIKLYPCALVDGTGLVEHWKDGSWRPYTEDELVTLLANDVEATPAFCRISRMIRDISAHDIMTGNKKVNLRQLVDLELERRGHKVEEIRSRELALSNTEAGELSLVVLPYETSNTQEYFLQWVTPENKIAGFLRLSLPNQQWLKGQQAAGVGVPGPAEAASVGACARAAGVGACARAASVGAPAPAQAASAAANTHTADVGALAPAEAASVGAPALTKTAGTAAPAPLPINPGEAMIREVHVYGRVAGLGKAGQNAQHHGLGTALVEKACEIARSEGFARINVISAIGTRGYYRRLGFANNGLYQQRKL